MIITITDIQLYEILKQKLGNKEAESLVGFVDTRLKDANEQNLKTLATKEDMKDLKIELKKDIADISVKLAETKTDILRWVFAFFVPLMLALIGLYIRK